MRKELKNKRESNLCPSLRPLKRLSAKPFLAIHVRVFAARPASGGAEEARETQGQERVPVGQAIMGMFHTNVCLYLKIPANNNPLLLSSFRSLNIGPLF